MGKKRLVIDLEETEHRALMEKARAEGLTVSNYVRRAIKLPELRQGVRREPPKVKPARAKRI